MNRLLFKINLLADIDDIYNRQWVFGRSVYAPGRAKFIYQVIWHGNRLVQMWAIFSPLWISRLS